MLCFLCLSVPVESWKKKKIQNMIPNSIDEVKFLNCIFFRIISVWLMLCLYVCVLCVSPYIWIFFDELD